MSLIQALRNAAPRAISFLLPGVCAACGTLLASAEHGLVCGVCWSRCLALPRPLCERCGHPNVDDRCNWCPMLAPYVRAARSVCWMPDGAAGAIVHAFKYAGWHAIGAELARRMAREEWPADVALERSALVPVPLSPSRRRERGYDQCAMLASALTQRWQLPVWEDVLVRRRNTRVQAQLTPEQRLTNVAGAFEVTDNSTRLRGSHVVVVDDVVTTAATLNSCAAALFHGGARTISYVTFGRARAPGDAPA